MIRLIPDFVTPSEEAAILAPLGAPLDLGRKDQRNRIINYGHMELTSRTLRERALRRRIRSYRLDPDQEYVAIPGYFNPIIARLLEQGLIKTYPVLVTINEYLPGQGIQAHRDDRNAGAEIVSIGLASDAKMMFTHKGKTSSFMFTRRALVTFNEAHRYQWFHQIKPVAALRYSVVFRQQGCAS